MNARSSSLKYRRANFSSSRSARRRVSKRSCSARMPAWYAGDVSSFMTLLRWRRPTWLGLSVLGDIFVQAEDVAFRVLEPRGLFRAEHSDVIDRLEARQVVVGEHDTARLERADRGDDVLDLEAQGRMRGLGAAGFREERDLGSAAAVYELAALFGADRFQPELLAVEAAGALQIDDREHAADLRAFQNVAAWCGCVHVVSLRF